MPQFPCLPGLEDLWWRMEGWLESQLLSLWWDETSCRLQISQRSFSSQYTFRTFSFQSALIFKDVKVRGFWVTQWKKDHSNGESVRSFIDHDTQIKSFFKMNLMRLSPQMKGHLETCWMNCAASSSRESWQLLPALSWASKTTARLWTQPCSLSLQLNRSWSCEHTHQLITSLPGSKCMNWSVAPGGSTAKHAWHSHALLSITNVVINLIC